MPDLGSRVLSASAVVAYVAVGAAAILSRSLTQAARDALAWALPRNGKTQREEEGGRGKWLMGVLSFARAVALLALGVLIVTTPTPAMARRLTCRDGDPNIVVSPRGLGGMPFCNHDEPGDSVCTFAICSDCLFTRGCVGPESGVCPAGELPPGAEVVTVPVKQKRVRRIVNSRVVFRCRAPVPCDEDHRCAAVTRTCEDGVLGPVQEGQCDLDEQANGVCTFWFFCLEVCGPLVGTMTVPAGETRIVRCGNLPRIDVTQYTLRCQRSP